MIMMLQNEIPKRREKRNVRNKKCCLCKERAQQITRGSPAFTGGGMNRTSLKRQWRAEQKAVSPTDKKAIHGLIKMFR